MSIAPKPQENFLLSEEEWKAACNSGDDFDFIVVGSSFCAFGFIYQTLQQNPDSKILIIEQGNYISPESIQDLSPQELGNEEKSTEKRPWSFTPHPDAQIQIVRGINFLLGGRSSYWKAWCPEPKEKEMDGWPVELVDKVKNYFPKAKKLLSVRNVNSLDSFNYLQNVICTKARSITSKIESVNRVEDAQIAIIEKKNRYGAYQKYSVLEPLLEIMKAYRNVKAVVCCVARKIEHKDGRATVLKTSRGDLSLGKSKLILAMSTLPSTTIMLNSFHMLDNIGKRFTGHYASYTFARVPCEGGYNFLLRHQDPKLPEMAAIYIAGEDKASKLHFHLQLNAVAIVGEQKPNLDVMRNLLKTPKENMLKTCKNHIVFVCASLGQLDHNNPNNTFLLENEEGSRDITRNARLRFSLNAKDEALWNVMDKTTFEVLEHLAPSDEIEYWNTDEQQWKRDRPPVEQIRHDSLVHPASTMWIGTDSSSPVNPDYRFRGVSNVYLTGGALWPSGGSWNPTCTMTAMAMDLADKLNHQTIKSEEV